MRAAPLAVFVASAAVASLPPGFARAAEDVPVEEARPADVPKLLESEAATPDVSTEYFALSQDGFRVSYHPAARERVRDIMPRLARIRDELSAVLGAPVLAQVEVRVAALPIEIERLVPPHAETLPAHGGLSFPDWQLVVVSLGSGEAVGEDLESCVRHHLAHLALAEASKGAAVPSWFDEGFAVHFGKSGRFGRFGELEIATLSGDPPSLGELAAHRSGPRAEAIAADFARFAISEHTMPALLEGLRRGLPFERALENAFGTDGTKIDRDWRRDNTRRYGVFPIGILLAAILLAVLVVRLIRKRRREQARARPARQLYRTRLRLYNRRRETKLRVPIHVADQEVPRVEHDGDWHTLH